MDGLPDPKGFLTFLPYFLPVYVSAGNEIERTIHNRRGNKVKKGTPVNKLLWLSDLRRHLLFQALV